MNLNWRGGRVVEGARLESVYRGNSIMGSNPILSAIPFNIFLKYFLLIINKVCLFIFSYIKLLNVKCSRNKIFKIQKNFKRNI